MKTVKFQIDSCDPKDELRFEDFLSELAAIKKALDAINKSIYEGETISYKLMKIRKDSPAYVEILPQTEREPVENEKRVTNIVGDFYKGLANPMQLEPNVARAFYDIGKTVTRSSLKFLGNGNGEAEIEVKESFERIITKSKEIEITSQISFISGKLEALNLHGDQKTITIYPEYGITKVRCIVPKDLEPIIEKAVNKKVTVFGTAKTRVGDIYPFEILASDIKINKSKDEIPRPEELWGISENKGNLSPEEFLRNLRND